MRQVPRFWREADEYQRISNKHKLRRIGKRLIMLTLPILWRKPESRNVNVIDRQSELTGPLGARELEISATRHGVIHAITGSRRDYAARFLDPVANACTSSTARPDARSRHECRRALRVPISAEAAN
jgi:hypothetical protein